MANLKNRTSEFENAGSVGFDANSQVKSEASTDQPLVEIAHRIAAEPVVERVVEGFTKQARLVRNYFKDKDMNQIRTDFNEAIRKRPFVSLSVAFLMGFALSKVVRRRS